MAETRRNPRSRPRINRHAGAAGLAVLALLSVGAGAASRTSSPRGPLERAPEPDPAVAARSVGDVPCPAGSLADEPLRAAGASAPIAVCVRWPESEEVAPAAESVVNAHRDPRGRWVVYDQIPRRPERPADYHAYRYPVPCDGDCVLSGYDLDQPDDRQRRGSHLRAVGHGAIDLGAALGTPVTAIALEHERGPPELLYAGPLFGTTIVTRHSVREGGQLRDYVLILGHLAAVASPFATPAPRSDAGVPIVAEGETLGFVGDTGSPGIVHLHLEVRRVRAGVDVKRVLAAGPGALLDNAITIACDPRNVLPLRE